MKILVLMPLDEKWAYYAAAIWENMSQEAKNCTFAMPFFMDWMVQSKKSDNWIVALFDAIVSARVEYQQTEGDLIILGNCERNYCDKFDVIFNFQDAEESLPFEDKGLEKIKEVVENEPTLVNIISNLYTAADSTFSLMNCKATGEFLSDYLKTGVKAVKYEQLIKNINERIKGNSNTGEA